MRDDIISAQTAQNKEIESKCNQIIKDNAPENITAYCKIMEPTLSPKEHLIDACYDKKADVLVVGSRGLSHSLTEKVTQSVQRIGAVADYAVHHAPCDVLVIKKPHEY